MANKNYVLLGRYSLTSPAASVTFANIPTTGYTDLKIEVSARSTATANNAGYYTPIGLQFQASNANYGTTYSMYGTGSATGRGTDTPFTVSSSTYLRLTGAGILNSLGTANTYSNFYLYVPNYASGNSKIVLTSLEQEQNASTSYIEQAVSVWDSATPISNISIAVSAASFDTYSSFALYGLATVGTNPVVGPKAVGGDIVVNDGTYWYHAFLNTSAFVPKQSITADVLVIAGGGGGGPSGGVGGGGGGAGGVLYYGNQSLTPQSYACAIGSGGSGATSTVIPTSGTNSKFGSLSSAIGGGRAGGDPFEGVPAVNGYSGGSGGGGGSGYNSPYRDPGTGGTSTSGQGNAGGNGNSNGSNQGVPGGGGGAGAPGGSASGTSAGNGGIGTNTYSAWATATGTGESGYYAGGGGGGNLTPNAVGTGGTGGGGRGGNTGGNSTAGGMNTGGGGGGNGGGGSYPSSNGGSGIIIIKYPVA